MTNFGRGETIEESSIPYKPNVVIKKLALQMYTTENILPKGDIIEAWLGVVSHVIWADWTTQLTLLAYYAEPDHMIRDTCSILRRQNEPLCHFTSRRRRKLTLQQQQQEVSISYNFSYYNFFSTEHSLKDIVATSPSQFTTISNDIFRCKKYVYDFQRWCRIVTMLCRLIAAPYRGKGGYIIISYALCSYRNNYFK